MALHNVDAEDAGGVISSGDCAQYEVRTLGGTELYVLVNHFKSQSGGGGDRRKRQADKVRAIVDRLVADARYVIVLGDLNEAPPDPSGSAPNLSTLFDPAGPLVSCYDLPGLDVGNRPRTFDSCGIRNRLDYILISTSLRAAFQSRQLFRTGLWESRRTRPDAWGIYLEMTDGVYQHRTTRPSPSRSTYRPSGPAAEDASAGAPPRLAAPYSHGPRVCRRCAPRSRFSVGCRREVCCVRRESPGQGHVDLDSAV